MPWKVLDATSQKGIRVTFNDGKIEDFMHSGGIKFSAQVWTGVSDDITNGELAIGYWDSDGEWQYHANFRPTSYAYVKIIM